MSKGLSYFIYQLFLNVYIWLLYAEELKLALRNSYQKKKTIWEGFFFPHLTNILKDLSKGILERPQNSKLGQTGITSSYQSESLRQSP